MLVEWIPQEHPDAAVNQELRNWSLPHPSQGQLDDESAFDRLASFYLDKSAAAATTASTAARDNRPKLAPTDEEDVAAFTARVEAFDSSCAVDVDMAARRLVPQGLLVVMPVPSARRGVEMVCMALQHRGGPVGKLDLDRNEVPLPAWRAIADVFQQHGIEELALSSITTPHVGAAQAEQVLARMRGNPPSASITVPSAATASSSADDTSSTISSKVGDGAVSHSSSSGGGGGVGKARVVPLSLDLSNSNTGQGSRNPLHQCLLKEVGAGGVLATVRHLNLGNAFLGGYTGNGPMVHTLAEVLRTAPAVQHIDLSRNRLSGVAVQVLLGALTQMSSARTTPGHSSSDGLHTVILDWNTDIGTRGAHAAGALLSSCKSSLRRLSVAACGMQEASARAFAFAAAAPDACAAAAGGSSGSSSSAGANWTTLMEQLRLHQPAQQQELQGAAGGGGGADAEEQQEQATAGGGACASSSAAAGAAADAAAGGEEGAAAGAAAAAAGPEAGTEPGCDVDISYNHISAVGLALVASSLLHTHLPVTGLRIRCNDHVGDQAGDPLTALAAFMQALASAPRLRVLDMSGTRIPPQHMAHLVRCLAEGCGAPAAALAGGGVCVPPLAALNLSRCMFGMHNTRALCAALQPPSARLHPLRVLCLRQCDMGWGGVEAVARLLTTDVRLQYVLLGQRPAGEAGGRETAAACRALEGCTVVRTEPWPMRLKAVLLLSTGQRLPHCAYALVFSYLRTPVVRLVQADCP